MKIICVKCEKLMGETEPFDDPKEIKAKCTDCVSQEKKKRASQKVFPSIPKGGKKIILENGSKGLITIAGKESEDLSLWDVIFDGRKFFCSEDTIEEFEKHLESIPGDEFPVTFLHSMTVKLDSPKRRGKKNQDEPPVEKKPSDSTTYNCTVKVSKAVARQIFRDKQVRMEQVVGILADATWKAYVKDRMKEYIPGTAKEANTAT